MSAIIVMPVLIPAATAAWPLLAGAAAAAAASMGYSVAPAEVVDEARHNCVDLPLENAEPLTQGMNRNEALTFTQDGAVIRVHRNQAGRVVVNVSGAEAEEELRAIGREMSNALVRQYAYHQLVTELKQREFSMVDEQTEDDGTIRLRVRAFR